MAGLSTPRVAPGSLRFPARGNRLRMDLTPFLATADKGTHEEGLESIEIPGRVAVAAKGRFLLRALCRSFGGYSRITCAVTDQESCLEYLADLVDRYRNELEQVHGHELLPGHHQALNCMRSCLRVSVQRPGHWSAAFHP